MEASASSSKVTVEYHDPSGIFPLVADHITGRLPLRNLNWQSPSRPLRQIKSLHVEFVADSTTQNNLRPPSARTDTNGPNSFEIVSSGGSTHQNAVRERRHQIPGLKKSPYLKIYVLRCDDKEGYKESERKRIREWIRDNAKTDGRRDDHNAFEWMILHVVIPDTIAASEPRWRDVNSKESDELKERPKSNAKWPGKSTKTVFDRLRADFNESGKSGHDRVAQIRLLKSVVPPDLLPTPAIAPTLEESASERENAWNDLITKLKNFILGSFDLRVRQYESDIAEQEARRALPGWNFCTFFIHKEGLAKALESIGLVEDALAIYDELSIGLETVVHDVASGQNVGTATSFASFTDDIRNRIVGSPTIRINGPADDDSTNQEDHAIDLFTKDYRELIVTSNISVFDFACYIFSRQKALLLRLANARSIRLQLGDRDKDGGEDLVLTSEVCWRASRFIHTSARTLRQDLNNGAATSPPDSIKGEVDSLVCAWTDAVASQVLREASASVLQELTSRDYLNKRSSGHGPRRRLTDTLGIGAEAYPQRSTSLPGRRSNPPELRRPSSRSSTAGTDPFRPQSTPGSDHAKPAGFPGQAELATYRAELILMRRKMLEKLAARQGWYAGWASIEHGNAEALEEVNLSSETDPSAADPKTTNRNHTMSASLRSALENEHTFRIAFEKLTDLAIRHYSAATQSKSAESLMGDMAILKTQSQNYSAALIYFEQIMPRYAMDKWNLIESQALRAYSTCLREVQRKDEYVQTVLNLLSRACSRRLEHYTITSQHMNRFGSGEEETLAAPDLFPDLIAYSTTLSHEVTVDAEKYFADIQLSNEVKLRQDGDGFSLQLSFQHLLDDEIEVHPSALLVRVNDSSLEIRLQTESAVVLKQGLNTVELVASTVASGAFLIRQIVLKAGKIRFHYLVHQEAETSSLTTAEIKKDESAPRFRIPPFVYVYPAEGALKADVKQAKETRIGRPRNLEITLSSGNNEVQSMQLKTKPNSAGLRLHLADASCSGIDSLTGGGTTHGQVSLGQLSSKAIATVLVPYTLEQNVKEISVRVEISYTTSSGSFTLLESTTVRSVLPLDVDVNDKFHFDVLFSQFTVRAIDQVPLSVIGARLEESDRYAVRSPPFIPLPATVFSSQPMQLAYQITRKPQPPQNKSKQSSALALRLQYHAADDVFYEHLDRIFTADIQASAYAGLARLLSAVLLQRSREVMAAADMELAAMLGVARVPDFEAIGWPEVLATLNSSVRHDLHAWLQQWHGSHHQVDIHQGFAEESACQTIIIGVDVPNVDVVFCCSLDFNKPNVWVHHGAPIVVLGSPIQATVRVKHTAVWMTSAGNAKPLNGLNFACEIQADSDTWLIGGQRRSHFVPVEHEDHTFNIVLVPLQAGSFALPSLEIRLAAPTTDSQGTQVTQPTVSYETHYENAGQTVQVTRSTTKSRVDIVESIALPTSPTSRTGTISMSEVG